jgi:hypothetical protein
VLPSAYYRYQSTNIFVPFCCFRENDKNIIFLCGDKTVPTKEEKAVIINKLHSLFKAKMSGSASHQTPNNNNHRNSVSSTATSLANWCRKTLFGTSPSKDGGVNSGHRSGEEESEPLQGGKHNHHRQNQQLHRVSLTNEGDTEDSLVEECPICTSISKGKLCAAVPCKHEACERCWLTWQKQQQSKTCMICAQAITSVNFSSNNRFSKHKGSHFAKTADEALEEALRATLRVKNELLEIIDKGTLSIFSLAYWLSPN